MTHAAQDQTLLSVRAEAHRTVEPDYASVRLTVTATAVSAATAHGDALAELQALTQRLAEFGGEARSARNAGAALTWSAHSVRVHEDWGRGDGGPTGRHQADVDVVVRVRDFTLLARARDVLGGRDGIAVHAVEWSVDEDNPSWAQVRADAGLLSAESFEPRAALAMSFGRESSDADGASLDPVPQELRAMIDARLWRPSVRCPPGADRKASRRLAHAHAGRDAAQPLSVVEIRTGAAWVESLCGPEDQGGIEGPIALRAYLR